MARPEDILSSRSPVYTQTPGALPDSVPFQFRLNSPDHEENAVATDFRAMSLIRDEGIIVNSDMPTVAEIIAGGPLIGESLRILNPDLKVDSVNAMRLQMGVLAHHLLFGINIQDKDAQYIVAYIPRFPLQHERYGRLAENDFRDLKQLRTYFDRIAAKNPDVAIVRPLATTQFDYKGREYSCFTTAFNPKGEELHVSFDAYTRPGSEPQIGIPIYHHPLILSPEAKGVERAVVAQSNALKTSVERKSRQISRPEDLTALLRADQLAAPLINQQRSVLRADAIVFAATQGRFPEQHNINSGDWMGSIYSSTLKPHAFTLVTARGGLVRMTDDEWVDKMRSPHMDLTTGDIFDPFSSLSDAEMKTVLSQVRRELGM